jgi:Zn-dependent protease with chaperone function
MKTARQDFTGFGFAKTFVLPAFLVFLIPVLSLLFFLHAEAQFDARAREAIIQQIQADPKLSNEDRNKAVAFFTQVPFSRLMTDEQFAAHATPTARFDFLTFRWAIRLSILSIVGGIAVFLVAGVCVACSLHSQFVQYVSLLAGWHVLRIYGALQTIVLGALVVALSYWVTALWFHVYSIKLILAAGLIAIAGVIAVIVAIFKNPKIQFVVEGAVLNRDAKIPLWNELSAICTTVGTDPPDQVIAGIDDNFFVTEQPVTVNGNVYRGKTLYVSLALLKHLHVAEANAVLAHEMAHFSGQDTLYSKKISPLLLRYRNYLEGLHNNAITMPVFYFMLCFRALFELSLSKLSRAREFRADEVAATTTSARDLATALLRTAAYSKFRQKVEIELFKHEQALETADVSARIERGFPAYVVSFASEPDIGRLATPHPFDSHPPLSQRLSAHGFSLNAEEINALLATAADGRWRCNIPNADELEQQQWKVFEERFRTYHEQTLPYRFLPETAEELAVVVKSFPELIFEGSAGIVTIDHEKIMHAPWDNALYYREITKCELTDEGVLKIHYDRGGKNTRSIKTKKLRQRQQALEAFQHYYGRYLAAAQYQNQKRAAAEPQESQGGATETDPA